MRWNSGSTPAISFRLLLAPSPIELLEHQARRLGERLAVHPRIARHPGDFRPPWQRDDRIGIGHDEEIGMRRRLVEPGGEAGKAGTRFLHLVGGLRRHQLGALGAEQIGEIEQEELDLLVLGVFREFAIPVVSLQV